ncbi:hypothetical protein BSKO_00186 [Bryopsis sp. KO-2023]|nr:hypothetical protein BSKO_00186 [Bryopsis sp. KO-2023]
MFVTEAQKTSDSHKMLRERFENIQFGVQRKIHGKNLYVKNIEPSIDDESFKAILESSHFGEITSSRNHPTFLFTCISPITPDNSEGANPTNVLRTWSFGSLSNASSFHDESPHDRQPLDASSQQPR